MWKKLYTNISVTDKYDVLNQDHQNIKGKTLKSALTADQLIFNIRDIFLSSLAGNYRILPCIFLCACANEIFAVCVCVCLLALFVCFSGEFVLISNRLIRVTGQSDSGQTTRTYQWNSKPFKRTQRWIERLQILICGRLLGTLKRPQY